MHTNLSGVARTAALAALSCAGALIVCAIIDPPGRAAVRALHEKRDRVLVEPLDLSLAQQNKILAVPLIIQRGWSYRQWKCLDRLWTRESGWNHLARNHWSGAYGIPQALPAGKMRSAGADWRTSPATQIAWGVGYIEKRYGSPCAAWGHSQVAGWY